MDRIAVAVLGAGNVRCTPPVLAALAAYFGERPLDVVLYDPDPERLDLFDRLARTFFAFTKSVHRLWSTEDAGEALAEAARVIVQLDLHGASKVLKMSRTGSPNIYDRALPRLLDNLSPTAEVLSLLDATVLLPVARFRHLNWPAEQTEAERVATPHQALRWIHGEEYPFEFFAEHEDSPLKAWLDDPATAPLAREN